MDAIINKLSERFSVSRHVSKEELTDVYSEDFIESQLKMELFKQFVIDKKINFNTNYIFTTKKELDGENIVFILSMIEVEILKKGEYN